MCSSNALSELLGDVAADELTVVLGGLVLVDGHPDRGAFLIQDEPVLVPAQLVLFLLAGRPRQIHEPVVIGASRRDVDVEAERARSRGERLLRATASF